MYNCTKLQPKDTGLNSLIHSPALSNIGPKKNAAFRFRKTLCPFFLLKSSDLTMIIQPI